MFSGSIPALITPFENGHVDFDALAQLIDWHIIEGSSALVLCGTTGECPTLDHSEHGTIIAAAVAHSAGRIPIIAGAGSNSTQEALTLNKMSEEAGAIATLHVTGYYNKPSAAQVIGHFRALSDASSIPIIVYDIPSRMGIEFDIATVVELARMEHIIGIKDSTGDVCRLTEERLQVKDSFCFLSGDDGSGLGYMAHGGHGCISVTANVAPRLCAQMYATATTGDFQKARAIHEQLMPLHRALFIEPSPGGIKYAMSRLGLCREEMRAPLTPVTADARYAIDQALEIARLLE